MKVLLISHNPITTYQSMGKTFLSLFSEFTKEELCQLYVYPTLPDVCICNSYYRITDRNILQSYFRFGNVTGREIPLEQIDTTKHDFFENEKEENFLKLKKTPIKTICRDAMWKCARWYNKSLEAWIKEQQPTCIFLAPGEAMFIYDVALFISRKHNLPIITYICDEFYFIEKTDGFADSIRLRLLQNKIRELMKHTKSIVSISEEIKRQYFAEFKIKTDLIMTGASIDIASEAKRNKYCHGITYLGNLAYDRISSLLDIGKAMDEINEEYNIDVKLFLYTRTLSDDYQKKISEIKSIVYCGYVTGDAFVDVLHKAEALLHVESFSSESIERVKNSISTKIADSLASGNPLVAYAPSNIASMNYLISSGAALTITDRTELKDKIKEFVSDEEKRGAIATRAVETARNNHIAKNNSLKLRQICLDVSY